MSSPPDQQASLDLDWNLRATDYRDTYFPFRHHIASAQHQVRPDAVFSKFPRLPCELQEHILSFCDPSTLFQLTHVSFATREEAKKLFWSDPETRFLIDGQWLLAGGHPRHTDDDLEALTCMQHIEVNFNSYYNLFGSKFVREWSDGGSFARHPESEKHISMFWEVLRRRFPRVSDVVFTLAGSLDPGAPVSTETTLLAAASPDDIAVSTSEKRWHAENWDGRSTRYLWQSKRCDNRHLSWDLVNTSWTPRRILPPAKSYSGTAGAWQRYNRDQFDLAARENARQWLAVQALETYYHAQHLPCPCPYPPCDSLFEHPGELLAHSCMSEYYYNQSRLPGLTRLPLPPSETLRAAFERHDALLGREDQRLKEELARMRIEWGEPESVERYEMVESFLEQLRCDPLYKSGTEPETSEIWYTFERAMNNVKLEGEQ